MKSQYYKQIELDTFPKKTSNHQQAKRKLISDTATHNAMTHSRNFKSQKRSMINSIDLMRKSKQENENKTKILYSKPTITMQSEAVKYDAQWVELKCLECDALKAQQAKRIKELQMIYEQQLTEEKEKYIMMEKKYLLKENQYIKLLTQCEKYEQAYAAVEADYNNLRANYESLENNLKTVEIQHDKLLEQTKTQNEKIENLHHFLKLYVQQTKIIINWAHMFEQIQDQLPTLMHLIKQDLLIRRMDFEITLKEAATFQKLNFSQISSNKEEASGFLGDDSGCENFMKYLKHEPRPRAFNHQTSNKKGQSLIDSFNNKENIDFLNGISIKSLLSSNTKDRKSKQRLQPMNDDCLRLLLIQAKTIESSIDLRGDSIKQSRMVEDFSQQKSIFA